MWLSIFVITLAAAVFLNVAALMMQNSE